MGCVPIPAGALALRGAASAVSALLDVGIFIFSFMTTGSRDPAREGCGMASADKPRGIASCGTLPVARSGAEGGATSASGADAPRGEGGMARTRAALRATTRSRAPAREGWGTASADEPRGIASCGTFPVARAGVERGATSASGGAIAGEAPGRMATTGSKATGRAYAVTDSGIRALLSAAAATVLSADAAADESVHIGGWLAKM